MRKKFILCAVVISLSLLLVACPPIKTTPPASTSATQTELPTVQVSPIATTAPAQVPETPIPPVAEVKIQVRGVGIAPRDETDPTRRKQMAIRAAELDADRIFAQWQAGVEFDSETISIDRTVELDTIRETIKASLRMLRNTIEEQFDNQTGEAAIVVEYVAEVTK